MVSERRISHRLVHYWQQIKGDRVLPSPTDMDAEDIADMWDDCFQIHLREGEPLDPEVYATYGYVGKHLQPIFVEGYGAEAHLLTLPPERFSAAYQEMQMTKLPIIESAEEFNLQGRYIKYRLCLLPLGRENGKIENIFGGMRFTYV